MKAYVLHGIGDLRYEDVPVPQIAGNEVLVEVKAAGICGSDIPRIYKTGAYHHPLIPGHEFSGRVAAVTERNIYLKNKRVGIFPLIPCGKCGPCRKKQYEMCRSYSYLGSRRDGGFAEYVSVPADNLIELPDNVSYEEAAMLEPLSVAVHAIRRAGVRAGDTVTVCGLGTVGLFTVMLLKEAGVKKILAAGNKSFQKEHILRLGIPEENYCSAVNENITGWINEKTNGNGTDIFFECVGKNETISLAADSTAPAGKIMLVGNPCSDITLEKKVYWKILRNQLTVMGTWNSSFTHNENDDWHYALKKISDGLIAPSEFISHKLSMNGFEKGFHIMRDKSEDYIKVIMSRQEGEPQL